ncbi:MAG: flagellar motor switch protein FliM [Rickettsiales bacterium]
MSDDDIKDREGGEADGGDDDAAAAWAAALEAEEEKKESGAGGASSGHNALTQDEIDSLLGFENEFTPDEKTGLEMMLEKAIMSYERLPMLEIIFDRFVRMLSTSLRNFTSENVDVDIQAITSMRFGEYVNSIPMPAVMSIFKAVEWENLGVVTFNGSLVYSLVDVLFGGRRVNKPIRIEGRPYTTIERNIVTHVTRIVLMDMADAFDPLSPTTLQFERLETNPRFATIVHPSDTVIIVKLRVDMEDRGGGAEIVLPLVTLEPIKPLLSQTFLGENAEKDSTWENYLSREMYRTDVRVDAVLGKKYVRMRDVMRLEVGKTLILDTLPDQDIALTCGGVEIMKGKVGRVDDDMAAIVTHALKSAALAGAAAGAARAQAAPLPSSSPQSKERRHAG